MFILDSDGVMVSHAARPERLGLTLEDLTGFCGGSRRSGPLSELLVWKPDGQPARTEALLRGAVQRSALWIRLVLVRADIRICRHVTTEIESSLNQTVNPITAAQAACLCMAARIGLELLRWLARLLVFGFYVVTSSLLRLRLVVRCCAWILVRWKVDVAHAMLDLHPHHLTVRPRVGGVSSTNDASASLRMQSPAGQFGPQWGTQLRPDRLTQDNQWTAWAQRRDRHHQCKQPLEQELRRAYRFPSDT